MKQTDNEINRQIFVLLELLMEQKKTFKSICCLHLIVEDALCGVRHEGQVVGSVDHLSVIIIETANL